MSKRQLCNFENSYSSLPSRFFAKVAPAKFASPHLIQWNESLATELGLNSNLFTMEELAQIFSGQTLVESSVPIAMAYAGHQFAHFVPQLGDGRALLLGEIVTSTNRRVDVQLKGSGETPFSRRGDGRSALGPVIREYIVSEAMHALSVPTTRSLAAVATGEMVQRERTEPGGISTRVALSLIRIGHFEYFAARQDTDALKQLLAYATKRLYPEIEGSEFLYLEFFKKVVERHASLIAQWMDIGFIHGVMNTDNMSVSGETIDFGPCAFMDTFDPNQVFSSIDRNGRYSYGNQPTAASWNLARLADCLISISDSEESSTILELEKELSRFSGLFETRWLRRMKSKLGLMTDESDDLDLVKTWLEVLHQDQLDYTLGFRNLARLLDDKTTIKPFDPTTAFNEFETRWRSRLQRQAINLSEVQTRMNQVNPLYIARNHQVERAIQSALYGDLSVFSELVELLKNPFIERPNFERYAQAPLPTERVTQTFCGT